jgi:hypothetical protein
MMVTIAWYNGMLIPKGATVLIPAYALNFTYHQDPEKDNSGRYLNYSKLSVELAQSPDYGNRNHYTFGSGRRNCVSIHLAERTLCRMIAQILWAFEIEPAMGNGDVIELDEHAYEDRLLLLTPLPFKVRLVPRSREHAEVVRKVVMEREEYLKKWGYVAFQLFTLFLCVTLGYFRGWSMHPTTGAVAVIMDWGDSVACSIISCALHIPN